MNERQSETAERPHRTMVYPSQKIAELMEENAKLRAERGAAIKTCRRICDEHGDQNWEEDDSLSDIIENHLWKGCDGG